MLFQRAALLSGMQESDGVLLFLVSEDRYLAVLYIRTFFQHIAGPLCKSHYYINPLSPDIKNVYSPYCSPYIS